MYGIRLLHDTVVSSEPPFFSFVPFFLPVCCTRFMTSTIGYGKGRICGAEGEGIGDSLVSGKDIRADISAKRKKDSDGF